MNAQIKVALRAAIMLGVLAASFVGAFLLRFEFNIPAAFIQTLIATLPVALLLKYVLLVLLRADRHSWRHTSLDDAVAIAIAMFAAASFLLGLRLLLPEVMPNSDISVIFAVPIGVIGIDFALSMLGLGGIRALRRLHSERRERQHSATPLSKQRRALLVGAGRVGSLVVKELTSRPDMHIRPVGFVDDNPLLQRSVVSGLAVVGTSDELPELIEEQQIEEVIITIASASAATVRHVTEVSRAAGIQTSIVPGMHEIVSGKVHVSRLRPVAVEDLLGRDPVDLDVTSIREEIAGEVVLVTGAGGSIGAELCRQIVQFGPGCLVLAERAETALWSIHRELLATASDVQLVPALANVCDADRMDQLLAEHQPTVVFHAAAHKHVPMVEENACEGAKNNVEGTRIVADLAVLHDVERFVLISTDKAVNPTSVMGMTKRVAERYVQHLATQHNRAFVSVRFGNVLGSTGSVIPIFEQQIREGGPITITDPEMRRYFMTIPEAAQLVIQAAAIGDNGDIFVLDMGEPVRIIDLANDLIRLSGLEPGIDVRIEVIGIRPGEKLFEELSLDGEAVGTTKHPKIFTGANATPNWPAARAELDRLLDTATAGDDPAVRRQLIGLIPELANGSGSTNQHGTHHLEHAE